MKIPKDISKLVIFAVILGCSIALSLRKSSFENAFLYNQNFETKNANEEQTCGYEKCYLGKEGMLNVHLVPHTHDDVGWLKSVDGYFYDTVQYILDTVNNELKNDAKKRFIYVEMAFFYRWWHSLDEEKKEEVRVLVNKGQLEFILGGWSMNDEASTHYSAIIDQHTVGFDFLKSTFGECGIPKIGWQIDPFGHSREQASLFAQFGFDGLFFARLDYQDYERRKKSKNLEHMWLGSASLGDQASLFTGALYDMSYSQPWGFCFECGDDPVRDDPTLDDFNLDLYVKKFLKHTEEQSEHFSTNHIMWTMGSDFQYSNARINFKNNDKLIKTINKLQEKGSKVNAFFSTPSCYLYALNKANITYEPKTDDFFPYAHRDHTFWSGYFTSRPSLKGYERSSNNFLQVCKQLHFLSGVPEEKKVLYFKRIMGVLQHHDAVSGTGKQFVTHNYAKMLSMGVKTCQEVVTEAMKKLMKKSLSNLKFESRQEMSHYDNLQFNFCNLLNVSYCPFTEDSQQFAMVIYNPLGTMVNDHVRIPLASNQYQVLDASLHPVEAQFSPVSKETRDLPDHRGSQSNYELVFPVVLPPLGFTTYFISKSSTKDFKEVLMSQTWKMDQSKNEYVVLENEVLKITFNKKTGLMETIENKEKSIKIKATQNFYYYQGMPGNNSVGSNQASGAYIFRPNGTKPLPISTGPVKISLFKGRIVEEVRQVFSTWASMVVRLYKGAKHFETEWTIGPIPHSDGVGKEVISRFDTSIDSHDTFYTDANGRELLKRRKDYRETWDLKQTEPVAGNYYPVNSRILIKSVSEDVQFSVLNDRSQGGSSLSSGQLELMLHRRLFYDDALGVGEALNESGIDGKGLVIKGKHFVILDTKEDSTEKHRTLARQLYMSPYSAFTSLNSLSPHQFTHQFTTTWSGINANKLPPNVHILSLEEWHDKQILIRLEHFYEKGEHSELSKDATVSLNDLFAPDKVVWLKETTLGANKDLSSSTRLCWNVKGKGQTESKMSSFVTPVDESTMTVHLKAMQIRTFLIKLFFRA